MVDVEKLSDAELRTKLMEFGFPVMPITGTTRKLMVKKLKLLMDSKNKIANDNRRSLGRYSSEEESDTDVRATKKDKNRRATMAAPPVQTNSNRAGVTLRKSLRSNDSDHANEDVVQSSKRTTTSTTKVIKTVQDEYDTGSDSEPEIIENDYDSSPQVSNSFDYKKDSPIRSTFSPSSPFRFQQSTTKYSPPKTVSSSSSISSSFSFSNKPVSPSRYTTTYTSNTGSNDDALDRLNQIRSRLSLGGNTGYDRPVYSSPVDSSEDKVDTPFLSNFTRRLSQLSSANSPKPEYDFKNDIIKEHDTNGAGSYSRYLGRSTRYRDINRDYYSRHDSNIMKNNMVSIAVVVGAFLFFIVVGAMYYGMRNDSSALNVAGYGIPPCVKTDQNAKPGINCILDDHLKSALSLMEIIKPELTRRAVAFACKTDPSLKAYMSEPDVVNYHHKVSAQSIDDAKDDLKHLEMLVFKNSDWGISVIQTDQKSSDITHENVLGSMDEANMYRVTKTIGLAVLEPDVPLRCTVYNAMHGMLNNLLIVLGAALLVYVGNFGYQHFKLYHQQKKDEVFNMVERIVEALQATSANEGENFLVINHVRDMILPITDRKRLEKTWEEAVKFLNENESRVRTEVQVVQGEPFEVWRWLGSPNLNASGSPRSKTWQGQAFETHIGSVNSLPCSPTPCLKVRGMVDDNERNYPAIREAVLSKCAHRCRILHCAVDNATKCVYLKCADQTDAAIAYRNLHGWWYAGHLVTVKYLRLERYNTRFPGSPDSGPYLKSMSPPTDWSS